MARWLFAAFALLLAAPTNAASPTIESVRANVREACGFEAFQKLSGGIVIAEEAEFIGVSVAFRLRFPPNGQYVRVISAKGEHTVGFDGTTRWGRNFSGPVRMLEEVDRDGASQVPGQLLSTTSVDIIFNHPW